MTEKTPKDINIVLHGINLLREDKEMSWMDAILEYCEVESYRIEEVGFLLKGNKNFIKILEDDFKRNKHLRGEAQEKISLLDDWS
jgi:hypothetical protein